MGWVNAVSLFQHAQRRLALLPPPFGAGLPADAEWRRDGPLPIDVKSARQKWWQNFLDDFDSPKIMPLEECADKIGKPSEMQLYKRQANMQHGILTSQEKAIEGSPLVTRMGASVDGVVGRVSNTFEKIFELIGFGLWL